MSAPLAVNTADGTCWTRRAVTRGGLALYAPEGVCSCPEFVMATLAELAEHGIVGSADALPMPADPEPKGSEDSADGHSDDIPLPKAERVAESEAAPVVVGYPPALPWARLMDADDLEGFLADLADAASGDDDLQTLAVVEDAIGRWRVIGEAQHAHNTAPGPNAEPKADACTERGDESSEWCTGCNTDHDPDECGYRPEVGEAS